MSTQALAVFLLLPILVQVLLGPNHSRTIIVVYAQSSCSLCPDGSPISDKYTKTRALIDGTTCGQLENQAQQIDSNNPQCASFYQLIGFATCGCLATDQAGSTQETLPFETSECQLCLDGSVPNPNLMYDSNTRVSCKQVQEYLDIYMEQTRQVCSVIQYQAVVNCGCPFTLPKNPSCPLCKNENERVSNPNALTEATVKVATCGVMEYILAVDIQQQYNGETCSTLQNYFSSKCTCSPMSKNQEIDMTSSFPSVSPVEDINSGGPTIVSTDGSSVRPSWTPTSQSTNIPSQTQSATPTSSPSAVPSIRPSVHPSWSPSRQPSMAPSRQASSSPSTSSFPSFGPSGEPTSSQLPSLVPTSILDMKPNCTALEKGIVPNVEVMAKSLSVDYYFHVWFDTNGTFDASSNYDALESGFMNLFDRTISYVAAGCDNEIGFDNTEKIHFVRMNELSVIPNAVCGDKTMMEDTPSSVTCAPMNSNVTVFYSTVDTMQSRRKLNEAGNVKAYVTAIIDQELPSMSQNISGVYSIGRVDENDIVRNVDSERLTSGTKAAIAVAVSCSLVAVMAIGILTRRKKETSPETSEIYPGTMLRSDDSISDNPTLSSGGRAQMTGWAGSVTDSRSDGSSRYSYRTHSVKASDASDGVSNSKAAPYRLSESSYLPSYVLRDLLGEDDADLSIDTRDRDDDLSIDHGDTIEL